MKSKLFRILGVIAVVAMIAASLVAPVSANVASVTATTTTAGGIISTAGNYSIYATLSTQLVATTTATLTYGAATDVATFASSTAYDQVSITVSGAGSTVTVAGATTGNGTFTTAGTATDIFTYAAGAQTATVTANAASTVAYKLLGPVTVGLGAGVTTTVPAVTADTITVTFPSTFTVPATGVTGTLAASSGWVTGLNSNVNNIAPYVTGITAPASSATAFTVVFTLAAGDYIGAQSQVLINITAGVVNPTTAGNYTVTVATSQETTAVTSSAFAISNPTPTPLPGVASVYNTASTPILINQYNSLASALTAAEAIAGGATIKLSAGTYGSVTGDTVTGAYPATTNITIQGTDPSAANVIIKATGGWNIVDTGGTLVIDSVTIDGNKGTAPLTVSSNKSVTVSNSNVQNGVLTIGATSTGTSNITKDTFTVKTGATGLAVTSATTVTGSTFNVTGTGWGISAPYDVMVSGSTFTGATNTTDQYLGNGISATSADTTATPVTAGSVIGTSTFTGLSNALTVNNTAAIVNFNGNTVTNCGQAPATGTSTAAIIVTSASTNGVSIFGNTITNGTYYILQTGAYNQQSVSDNTFTGNAKSIKSTDTSNTLVAARNWWGSAANVPPNVTLVSTTTAGLTFTPALGGAPGTAAFTTVAGSTSAVANPIAASATVGVNITSVLSTGPAVLGAAALAANPVAVAIPSADTAVKYWDVYGTISGTTANPASATIDFYGTTAAPITANSAILFYNSVNGTWVNAGGSANAFANYFEIYVGATTGSVITAAQFNGTPFVLVTIPTTLGTISGTTYPTNGATGVAVSATNTTFTWPAVTPPAGMTVTYQFALAQASANTTANEFAILDYSDNTITNAEPLQETLQYNTIYWWEVRAVTLNASGAVAATGPWTVSMFTTAPAPVTTTGTAATNTTVVTSVVITQPVTTVVSTQTSVVITQTTGSTSQAIPSYLLWAVIAVGAVLIIAVIVLIVRTRRIP